MSKFLAPIHTWLFNKIKLYEDLESNLLKAYTDKYGRDIEDLYENLKKKYSDPLENKPIEDLIDVSNIHGWLQERSSVAEARQAALITQILERYNKEEALNITLSIYNKQASACAEDSKQKNKANTAPEIFDSLNNYIIEGMPCDRVTDIIENSEDSLKWHTTYCLHKGYWESISGDINVFYKLRSSWIKTFVESINNSFTYNASYNTPGTLPIATHEIKRK